MRFVIVGALVLCLSACSAPLIPPDWGTWERIGSTATPGPIPGHEEPVRVSAINPVGEAAEPTMESGVTMMKYPTGTIIVKAGFKGTAGAAEQPAKLYVMIKKPEDPRARGGWLWVVRNASDLKEVVVDAPYCVDCHGYANQTNPYGDKNPGGDFRDYVFLPYTKSPSEE
jgi:hypothetical protein